MGLLFATSLGACGISSGGLAHPDASSAVPASDGGGTALGDATLADGASGAVDAAPSDATANDATSSDGSPVQDSSTASDGAAGTDAPSTCTPFDAGLGGALPLSAFTLVGNAAYDESSDGRITLTNSSNDQAGAAWYPVKLQGAAGYDLTFSFRVGPNDTPGDGITFAVLSSNATPGVGDKGDGLGLRGLAASDGGVAQGYAVVLDMFENQGDPTDLAPMTLKLLTMPDFKPVAETAVGAALHDGNVYPVDVSWRAPSSLTATLHGSAGALVTVTSSDPGLASPSAFLGFTGATGAMSDSHNEIAGITVTQTCQ
jgi:hypothetical protein